MNRCENCDRPKPTREEIAFYKGGEGEHLCWGGCEEEDWRTRALKAERERDEARAEVETLRAAIEGEPWGGAVLKRQRDEARAEVERLQKRLGDRAEVDSGKLAAAFTEGTLAAGDALRSKLREVAERQREACAAYLWAEYPSIVHAERIRATPLVTEDP